MKQVENSTLFQQLLRMEAKIKTTRGVNRQIDHVLNTATSGAWDNYIEWHVRCGVVADGLRTMAPSRGEARRILLVMADIAERWAKTNLDLMEDACGEKTS